MVDIRDKSKRALLEVVARLLDGERLSTENIETIEGLGHAQAARDRKHIAQYLTKYIRNTADGLQRRADSAETASPAAVVGATLMSGMSRLFAGTRYEQGMRDATDFVAARAAQPRSTEKFQRKFAFATRGGDPSVGDQPRLIEDLIVAVLDERRVHLHDEDFEGTERRAVVDPLSLLVYDHQLYLVARHADGRFKAHRFARVLNVTPTSDRFEYPPPSEYNLEELQREVWGVFLGYDARPRMEIVVEFAPRWRAFIRKHTFHSTQRLVKGSDCTLRFDLRPCPEFIQWLVGFGTDVTVLSPESVRDEVASVHRAAAALYPVASHDKGGATQLSPAGAKTGTSTHRSKAKVASTKRASSSRRRPNGR